MVEQADDHWFYSFILDRLGIKLRLVMVGNHNDYHFRCFKYGIQITFVLCEDILETRFSTSCMFLDCNESFDLKNPSSLDDIIGYIAQLINVA